MSLLVLTLSFGLAATASAPASTEAGARFRAAEDLYQQARYQEAIAEFEAAYALKPHAAVRFNVGRCYEELGDVASALSNYKAALEENLDADQIPAMLAAIESLETRAPAPTPVLPQQLRSPAPRVWTWVMTAGAGMSLAGGIGLGIAAQRSRDELYGSVHARAEVEALSARTTGLATGANVAYGAAAVAGVTALILFFVEPILGRAPQASPSRASP